MSSPFGHLPGNQNPTLPAFLEFLSADAVKISYSPVMSSTLDGNVSGSARRGETACLRLSSPGCPNPQRYESQNNFISGQLGMTLLGIRF